LGEDLQQEKGEEKIEEMSYRSEESDQNINFDAPTVATSLQEQDLASDEEEIVKDGEPKNDEEIDKIL